MKREHQQLLLKQLEHTIGAMQTQIDMFNRDIPNVSPAQMQATVAGVCISLKTVAGAVRTLMENAR